MGTPNREPQEYSRNMMEYEDPGKYIPIIFLLYSWGSLFGGPIKVPLDKSARQKMKKPRRHTYLMSMVSRSQRD